MSMLKPKSDIETVRQFILTDLEEGIKETACRNGIAPTKEEPHPELPLH